MPTTPRTQRRGWLKNGNPPADVTKAPRCGAKTRRRGTPCQGPAMRNGRCRLHGGLSTGAKTAEGIRAYPASDSSSTAGMSQTGQKRSQERPAARVY